MGENIPDLYEQTVKNITDSLTNANNIIAALSDIKEILISVDNTLKKIWRKYKDDEN